MIKGKKDGECTSELYFLKKKVSLQIVNWVFCIYKYYTL